MYTAELTAGKHVSPGLANRPFNQKLLSALWQIAANECTHTHQHKHTQMHKKIYTDFIGLKLPTSKSIYLWSDASCNWNECASWFVYLSVKSCLLLKPNVSYFSLETDRMLWVVFCLWTASSPAAIHTMQWLFGTRGKKNVQTMKFYFLHLCSRNSSTPQHMSRFS